MKTGCGVFRQRRIQADSRAAQLLARLPAYCLPPQLAPEIRRAHDARADFEALSIEAAHAHAARPKA